MALMTARPWKDPKTGVYHLRQRTPRELLSRVRGTSVSLPIGDSVASVRVGDIVQASLRTKEASEARNRHSVADGALKRFWEAQRHGPITLTHRQITALSGLAYASLTGVAGDEPGSPEIWDHILRIHSKARAAGKLDQWVGPSVDQILGRQGLVIDGASRARLIESVDQAFVQAATHIQRNAQGDYRPDPNADRFGEWEPASSPTANSPQDSVTVADLFDRWADYNADKKALNTIKRYRGSFRSLIQFAKDRDTRSLNGDDLYAWAQHREKVEGISAKAINKNDLVAVSSVFTWAVSRQGGAILSDNPVRGVRLDEPRAVTKREKTFREQEIVAILAAASAVEPSDLNPTLHYAFRWCPWLAAYSGARIAELTHLEKRDIRVEGGVTVMELRFTKTGIPRTVPIHEHLIVYRRGKRTRLRG